MPPTRGRGMRNLRECLLRAFVAELESAAVPRNNRAFAYRLTECGSFICCSGKRSR